MLKISSFCCAFLFVAALQAQINPVPAGPQKAPILIMGATAHIGNGQVIANSAIAFENGKLTLVADATTIRMDRSKFSKIYDATGKHVYPGFIGMDTRLGLVEIDAVRSTVDFSEIGAYNPNARTIVAYNTDSDLLPTVRANGVLLAQVTPQGGVLSGTSSVVQLDAWNWEDAAYRTDEGQHLNWPAMRSWGGWESGNPEMKKNEQYDKDIAALNKFFQEAAAYAAGPAPAVANPRFESMRGLFTKAQTLYIHTDAARTIQEAVVFAQKFNLKMVLVGAADAWRVADLLKANNVAVILGRTQRLPARDDEDYDQPYKTAKILHDKGILFAFSDEGAWRQRNVPFQAGQAVGHGLPQEAAVQALCLNAATILGIQERAGSLEVGKDANLFISEGDALDMRGNIVTAAFIQGRELLLDDKHKQLFQRYSQKKSRM